MNSIPPPPVSTRRALPSPPPPPPPPPSPQRSQDVKFADHLGFKTLDADLDEAGSLKITSFQYGLFSDADITFCTDHNRYVKVSLLEYASMVSRWLYRDNKHLKLLAQEVLPTLQSKASPKPQMSALRFREEELVILLGKKVVVKNEGHEVDGIFEGAALLYKGGRSYHSIRIGGSVPRELDLATENLTSGACTIRGLDNDQDDFVSVVKSTTTD